jgi:FkbM family methyltransferase
LQPTRRRIEELLWVLGLNRAAAPVWEWLRGGRAVQQSRMMREFYAELLPKGALVFDIGANVGTMTRVFASLGAKVVAVEPNADCARHIELTTSRAAVEVLEAAVGEANGVAVLKVSDRKDKMSSLSEEWREAVTNENQSYTGQWNRDVTVPMVTVDALIGRYGMPAYIKWMWRVMKRRCWRGCRGARRCFRLSSTGCFWSRCYGCWRNRFSMERSLTIHWWIR